MAVLRDGHSNSYIPVTFEWSLVLDEHFKACGVTAVLACHIHVHIPKLIPRRYSIFEFSLST